MYTMFYILSALILVSLFAIRLNEFSPTRYFFIRVFMLYKFCKRYENVDNFSRGEIEQLLNFLILNKCDEKYRVWNETRNGYRVKYYPEGVDMRRRKLPMHYVDIYDSATDIVVRIGFNECDNLKYQIEYRQVKSSFQQMFFASHQGSDSDFIKQYKECSSDIVKKYILYIMRRIL